MKGRRTELEREGERARDGEIKGSRGKEQEREEEGEGERNGER